MRRAIGTWRRFGRTPAVLAVVLLFGVGVVARLLLGSSAGLSVVLLGSFVAYCAARPSGGVDLFLLACVPNATAMLLEAVGLPAWPALMLVPFVVLEARRLDVADRTGTRA
ncbi:hypothetical protein [Patulibacter sp. SYSU D01012]|uniref:hypothetical protein n=1 Tax=Patulibacter sp. SYSU D01012 TaxID=2817381 RepID=UPI001B31056B|nr:hypothetical protein [Patulibacter sp. SYSU D01012]